MRWFVLLLGPLVAPSAFAADVGPAAFDGSWAWVPDGPRRVGAIERVWVEGDQPVLLVDRSGAVWRSGADGWVEVLEALPRDVGAMSTEEERRLQVEARTEELADDRVADPLDVAFEEEEVDEDALLTDDATQDVEPAEEEGAAPAEVVDAVADDVQADLISDPLLAVEVAAAGGRTRAALLRDPAGVDWVGRADGLWRIDADRPVRVLDGAVTALVVDEGGALLAGTHDGLRYVVDGLVFDVEDGTEGRAVRDLFVRDGVAVAASSLGLLVRDAALGWGVAPSLRGTDLDAVAVLSTGSVVVGGPSGVWSLRAEEGWARAVRAEGPEDSVRVLPLGGAHVLSGGSTGVWESVDAGATWAPRSSGLLVPTVWDLAPGPVLAGVEGLFRLVQVGDLSGRPPSDAFVSLGDLLGAARGRPELTAHVAKGARWKSAFTPQWVVQAVYTPSGSLQWGEGSGTSEDRDGDWTVTTEFVFSPSRSSDDEVEPVYTDDEIFFDVESEAAMLEARAERRQQAYDRTVAGRIAEMYVARAALVERRADPAGSLADRVADALRVAELEARMDVLSGFTLPLVVESP